MAVRRWTSPLARGVEFVLAATGFAHVFLGEERPVDEVVFLACWNTVAVSYLIAGAIYVRRHVDSMEGELVPRPGLMRGQRSSFLFTMAASLTGLSAALDVLEGDEGNFADAIEPLSVVTIICAWMLLHVGYARFYAAWDRAADARGFGFPGDDRPGLVEYLYFAITIGVSFAASDVTVKQRRLRWHVIVHSVASFFYNAIVLAAGVAVLTGR